MFTGYGKDIEDTAKGVKRGFYVVSFAEKVSEMRFVTIKGFDGEFFEYDATGKNSHEAAKELSHRLGELEVNGKVVVVRLKGELARGKTGDIDSAGAVPASSASRGAIYVQFNRFSLTTKEYEGNRMSGDDISAIKANYFRENIGTVKVNQPHLKGKEGCRVSEKSTLRILRQQQKIGETKTGYQGRITTSGIETLKISEEARNEMIVKKLKLENIRSYKSQVVEFPLGRTLFEGDIGSGKSTILMAIEFALFGLGSEKPGSLLKAGATEGLVSIIFESGGKEYMVQRRLVKKRNSYVQDDCVLRTGEERFQYSASEIKERVLEILTLTSRPTRRRRASFTGTPSTRRRKKSRTYLF